MRRTLLKKSLGLFGRSLAFVLYKLPRPIQFLLGDFIGILWFDILRIRRQVVLDNLQKAFPEKSIKERIKMGRWSLRYLGRSLIQYSYLPFMDINKIKKLVKLEGFEHLDEALAQNKGVCLLTLHLGNGDLGVAALSLAGYSINLISKEFTLRWLNDMWFGMRARLGTKFIAPRNSSYSILKALKANEVVIFVLDQFMGPPIGVKTKFFGHETGTAMGLTVMSKRTQAPVVPIYMKWNEDGSHTLTCLPAVEFEEQSTNEETLTYMTQKYSNQVEDIIKKHPEQWMWIHRRWKKYKF